MRPRIHGEFEITIEGRLLVSRVRGPWNFEAVQAYGEETARKVNILAGQPWGVLAITGGEPLHTPDSIDKLVEIIQTHQKLGRCGTALVFEGLTEPAKILQTMLAQMYILSQEPYIFANDQDSARQWLHEQLAQHGSGI